MFRVWRRVPGVSECVERPPISKSRFEVLHTCTWFYVRINFLYFSHPVTGRSMECLRVRAAAALPTVSRPGFVRGTACPVYGHGVASHDLRPRAEYISNSHYNQETPARAPPPQAGSSLLRYYYYTKGRGHTHRMGTRPQMWCGLRGAGSGRPLTRLEDPTYQVDNVTAAHAPNSVFSVQKPYSCFSNRCRRTTRTLRHNRRLTP